MVTEWTHHPQPLLVGAKGMSTFLRAHCLVADLPVLICLMVGACMNKVGVRHERGWRDAETHAYIRKFA